MIGFERSLYEVDEEDGSVTVAVRVLEGTLANDVEVLLTTTDGTATSSGERENTQQNLNLLKMPNFDLQIP